MRIAAIRDSVHQGDTGQGLVIDVPDGLEVLSAVERFVASGYLPRVRDQMGRIHSGTWSVWSPTPIAVLAEGWGPKLVDLNRQLQDCAMHNGVVLFAFAYHSVADPKSVRDVLYTAHCVLGAFVPKLNPFFLAQRCQ